MRGEKRCAPVVVVLEAQQEGGEQGQELFPHFSQLCPPGMCSPQRALSTQSAGLPAGFQMEHGFPWEACPRPPSPTPCNPPHPTRPAVSCSFLGVVLASAGLSASPFPLLHGAQHKA